MPAFGLDFLMVHNGAGVMWGGLFCTASSQNSCHEGSLSACCEPRESILLGMVFWGPAMSPQVAETFRSLFNEGLH